MQEDLQADLIWIESICDDPTVIERNIRGAKLANEDYAKADQKFGQYPPPPPVHCRMLVGPCLTARAGSHRGLSSPHRHVRKGACDGQPCPRTAAHSLTPAPHQAYETLSDDSQSYVKLINVGRQVKVNRVFGACRRESFWWCDATRHGPRAGYLPTRIVFFLMNLNINKELLLLARVGQVCDGGAPRL